jgi:hypothetical protein
MTSQRIAIVRKRNVKEKTSFLDRVHAPSKNAKTVGKKKQKVKQ